MTVTMTTITFGFFAILIARELPGRSRVWPYLVSGIVVGAMGFARIYLGAHWLTDVIGGMLLGIVWLLVLGLAYRSHVNRSFWMRPLAAIFYGTFAVAALWHAPKAVDPLLPPLTPPPPTATIAAADWWEDGWSTLPPRRNERDHALRWPLDVQVAGPLEPLQEHLAGFGWEPQPQADWEATLGLLDDDLDPPAQPVLPATLDTEAETLLLRRQVTPAHAQVRRRGRVPVPLADGTRLWVGPVQTLHFTRHFDLFGLWQPRPDGHAAWDDLREAVEGLDARIEPHPRSGLPVMRLRTVP